MAFRKNVNIFYGQETVGNDGKERNGLKAKLGDNSLKVVSATFLLVCFSSLKESNCENWKNVFCFTSIALFILEKIKF